MPRPAAVQQGVTPLLSALIGSNTDCADALIDAGAKIEVTKILLQCDNRADFAKALKSTNEVPKIADAIMVSKESLENKAVGRVKSEVGWCE